MASGQAWEADAFGAPGTVLRLRSRIWEDPGEGQVLVRVLACGVGLPDALMLHGGYAVVTRPPVTPGQEVCGIVVAVGPGSARSVGERVMAITGFTNGSGGYADYALVPESGCQPAPASLSDAEAAGFLIAYRTAYAALVERATLRPNEVLLVLGATGSSGAAAVDLGRALGARVIAVAGGAEKTAFSLSLSATDALDHRTTDIADQVLRLTDGRGADLIFDPVGGDLAGRALQAIARHGRLAVVGYASGQWAHLDALDMVLRSYSAVGVYAGAFTAEANRQAFTALIDLADARRIRPRVSNIYPFADTPEVLEMIERNAPPGKLVVAVGTAEERSKPGTYGGAQVSIPGRGV